MAVTTRRASKQKELRKRGREDDHESDDDVITPSRKKQLLTNLRVIQAIPQATTEYNRDRLGRRPALDCGLPTGDIMLNALGAVMTQAVSFKKPESKHE